MEAIQSRSLSIFQKDIHSVWERAFLDLLKQGSLGKQLNTFQWIVKQLEIIYPSKNLGILDAISFFFCFHRTLLPWRERRYELHLFGPGNYGRWQALYFTWKGDIFPCSY